MDKRRKRRWLVVVGSALFVAAVLIVPLFGKWLSEGRVQVQYIRTNGRVEGARYPKVSVIRSMSELEAYYEANKGDYSLGRRENPASDYTIGFLDACDKYDDAYFQNQSLVLVLLEEGSGSIRHEVTKVKAVEVSGEKQLQIHIDRKTPNFGTDDMAEWHLFIELPARVEVPDEEKIVVYIDGVAKE